MRFSSSSLPSLGQESTSVSSRQVLSWILDTVSLTIVASYVYAAEIFPTAIRSKGVAWSISWYFILACIWTSVAPVALATIGWKFYICKSSPSFRKLGLTIPGFMVLTVVNMVVVYFYFPETNRLTLEEIGALFGDEVAFATQVELGESVVDSTTKNEKEIAGVASVVQPVA